MKLRDVAQFASELPDGAVENEEGTDFIVWPARPVAEALHELLHAMGCEPGPVVSASFKGWEITFIYRGRPLWCRISMIERYIAYFDDKGLWPNLIGMKPAVYAEFLARLGDTLSSDRRFQDVRWYALKEIETDFAGALRPVA
jgi:hypothetical protein